MKKLGKRQLKQISTTLLSEKERVLNNIVSTDVAPELSEKRADDIDAASNDFESSRSLRFRNRDIFYLKKIENAIKKIEQEEFGKCDECDAYIRFERLVARPTACLCIYCKEEMEKEEFSSIHHEKSRSIGSSMNYVQSLG